MGNCHANGYGRIMARSAILYLSVALVPFAMVAYMFPALRKACAVLLKRSSFGGDGKTCDGLSTICFLLL